MATHPSVDGPGESLPETLKRLGTSTEGLSAEVAGQRLAAEGPNELPEARVNPLLKFLSYFWGPIPIMIEIAAVLSALVRHWEDFGIILVLLIMNAVVGFWEEHKADDTIANLKAALALKARVKRDGTWTGLAARELVRGDIIRLRIGDIVPADARILEKGTIQVDQSALTGESLPVERDAGGDLYSGSVVRLGETDAVVTATGKTTYIGKTAHLVETAPKMSHFQRAILKIGDSLILVALALVVLILAVSLFRSDNMLTTLQFVLVLTVAAIPVAMPTVLSVTMAVGAQTLAREKAIVRRLSSIEEMAGVDVLCSDKTGTLTQNRMTVGDPWVHEGIAPKELLLFAALASRAEDQDPIDQAVISAVEDRKALEDFKIEHFQPFDPVSKRTEASVKGPSGETWRVSKGAIQVILALAEQGTETAGRIEQAVMEFAGRGYRSLGVARSGSEGGWTVMGILPLFDPPRDDSKETIERTKAMGVGVKMVTGDQLPIAKEIARKLGLGTNILDSSVFSDASGRDAGRLAEAIDAADGFAQVFPEDKYHLVEALQKEGHIVGMTGDGVNDAPALKKADIGIAVAGATDAARSAADIVLLTPGLSVITTAIRESRKIFSRMTNYAIYRIAETLRVLFFMTLSILAFNFYPVTAVMIVLLALLNDGAILSIAYDRVRISDRPERWDMKTVFGIAATLGLLGVVASFGLFYLAERVFKLDRTMIQSLMYLKLSVAGHLTIFLTRTRGRFWTFRPSGLLAGAVFGTQALATLIAVFGVFMAPIGWKWALLVWGYALAWFLINDQVKILVYRVLDSEVPLLRSARSWRLGKRGSELQHRKTKPNALSER